MLVSVSKQPTLQDVADEVGMALTTVSYALRGQRGSAETVRRVREAADRLGYQANPIAAALAGGPSPTVAVLCGTMRDLWQQSLVADLSRALLAAGRHAVVADADGQSQREEALLSKLRAQRPCGLLVAPLDPFAQMWEEVSRDLPVVSIGDQLSQAPTAGAVIFDNASGFRAVFDHLADLGHRHLAVVVPQRPSTPDRPAERLVEEEAKRHNVRVDLIRTPPATADPDRMTHHLTEVLSAPDRPTAAFCLTDSFAFGMLRAARALGLDVPRDLSIIGFENVEVADLVGPGLTTVDWGRSGIVDAAVGQLTAAVDSGVPLDTRVCSPRLVIRGTTGPVPG